MPLKPGKSPKTISSNIGELLDSYSAKGSIGNSGPISKDKARKMAAAIAYSKARRSPGSKPRLMRKPPRK